MMLEGKVPINLNAIQQGPGSPIVSEKIVDRDI
jgi:hypothetical protein